MFLSIYYSEFYNKLSDTLKNKFLNKREIYILIFFSLTIMLLFFAIKFTFVELSTTSLILLLNFITALLMHNITKELETNLSESSENKDITNTEPEKNSDELNQIINLFTTLCILSILYTFYDLNQQIWSKPIENGKLQGGEEQKTMNLIFNRGFLLDLNEDINLSIPTRLQDDKKLYERLKYNQNIKVLPIGNVYKMYFLKKDDNTTKIYLVEEIKLKDNSESKLNLIAESSLSTNN